MTTSTLTPGVLAACPSNIREAVRMWILQNFSVDPKIVASIQVTEGDDETGSTVTIAFVEGTKVKVKNDKGEEEEVDRESITLPQYTALPFELDDLPDEVDTEAKSLDLTGHSDNPTTELPSQTEKESKAAEKAGKKSEADAYPN